MGLIKHFSDEYTIGDIDDEDSVFNESYKEGYRQGVKDGYLDNEEEINELVDALYEMYDKWESILPSYVEKTKIVVNLLKKYKRL